MHGKILVTSIHCVTFIAYILRFKLIDAFILIFTHLGWSSSDNDKYGSNSLPRTNVKQARFNQIEANSNVAAFIRIWDCVNSLC